MKRKITGLFVLLMMVCMLGKTPVQAKAVHIKSVKQIVLEKGKEKRLKVKNGGHKIRWHSANRKVAEVNKNGVVTVKQTGSSMIIAKTPKKTIHFKITVVDYTKMSEKQKSVVSYALKHIGNKYVYGGCSLKKGTDCSGFTMSVYKKFGYKLPHNANRQMKTKKGKRVSVVRLNPGDLVFYGRNKHKCSHVALYIGNNRVIHASNKKAGIRISHYRYRKPVSARRIL